MGYDGKMTFAGHAEEGNDASGEALYCLGRPERTATNAARWESVSVLVVALSAAELDCAAAGPAKRPRATAVIRVSFFMSHVLSRHLDNLRVRIGWVCPDNLSYGESGSELNTRLAHPKLTGICAQRPMTTPLRRQRGNYLFLMTYIRPAGHTTA